MRLLATADHHHNHMIQYWRSLIGKTRMRLPPAMAQAMGSPVSENMGGLHCQSHRTMAAASSSSSPLGYVTESMKRSIKNSLLDRAEGWRSPPSPRKKRQPTSQDQSSSRLSLPDQLMEDEEEVFADTLDDLVLTGEPYFWPNLPPTVEYHDPFQLTKDDLQSLTSEIHDQLLGTEHPVLNKAAAYFFQSTAGKKVRPMLVLLIAQALTEHCRGIGVATDGSSMEGPQPFDETSTFEWQRHDLVTVQRQLAQITELFHTASLLHDDVLDEAETRRNLPALHTVFGNKMAILAGDFLLSRACVMLGRMRDSRVVEAMSIVLEHLVLGEVLQMRVPDSHLNHRLVGYLRKNFYKTASLMALSCKSAAMLGAYDPALLDASYRYGKHVGMAFQLVDDALDFEGSAAELGKPTFSDLRAGLATAPVLFAIEEHNELETLASRKFTQPGDADRAVEMVLHSNGLERTKRLARLHAEQAMNAVLDWKPSVARDALVSTAYKIVERTR